MARNPKNAIWLSDLVVQIAVPETGSLVDVGGTKAGIILKASDSGDPVKFAEDSQKIGTPLASADVNLAVVMQELTAANLGLAIPGSSVSGNVITLGGTATRKTVKILVTGTDVRGNSHEISWAKAEVMGELEMPFSVTAGSEIAVGFSAVKPDTGNNTITITPAS